MIWLILGIISIAYGILCIISTFKFIGNSMGNFIVLFIFGLAVIFLGVLSLKRYTKYKKMKSERNPEEDGVYGKFKHTVGLSIPENTMCSLHLYSQELKVNGNGVSFNLPRNRILDIVVKSEEEIQKQLVSSTGGAIAGGILFGALGAMVGGRAKEKKIKTFKQYLIFTYEKDGKPEYIAFDTTDNVDYIKFVSYFQKYMQKGNMQVNL